MILLLPDAFLNRLYNQIERLGYFIRYQTAIAIRSQYLDVLHQLFLCLDYCFDERYEHVEGGRRLLGVLGHQEGVEFGSQIPCLGC